MAVFLKTVSASVSGTARRHMKGHSKSQYALEKRQHAFSTSGKRNQQVQYISTPPAASFSSHPQYYQRLAAAQARPRVNQARELYVQEGQTGAPNPALNALNTRNTAQQPQPSVKSDVQPAQSNVKSEAQYWQSNVGFGPRPRQGEKVYMKDKLQGTITNC